MLRTHIGAEYKQIPQPRPTNWQLSAQHTWLSRAGGATRGRRRGWTPGLESFRFYGLGFRDVEWRAGLLGLQNSCGVLWQVYARVKEHPRVFIHFSEALACVGQVSSRYSQKSSRYFGGCLHQQHEAAFAGRKSGVCLFSLCIG